jgi:hypothetical protein
MMSLKGLFEKTPEADVPREMISFAAAWLIELEVGALTSATYGEKNADRRAQDDADAACQQWRQVAHQIRRKRKYSRA